MGVCLSCLGLSRRDSESDLSENARLLQDEQYQPQYGGFAHGPHIPQPDPEELRRERDALERLCAQTSDKLIDVSQSATTEEGSKMASEYAKLFSQKFLPPERPSTGGSSGASTLVEQERAWLRSCTKGQDGWDAITKVEPGGLTFPLDAVFDAADHSTTATDSKKKSVKI